MTLTEPAVSKSLAYARRDLANVDAALRHVRRFGVAVQAGACLGVFPSYLASRFSVVHAFEPERELFVEAVRRASATNVFWYCAALGRERGGAHVSRDRLDGKPWHPGCSRVLQIPGTVGGVPVLRVDDLGLQECDLIYLDVEGGELDAVAGARETIARCRPVVVLEVNKAGAALGITRDMVDSNMRVLDYDAVDQAGSDVIYRSRS